MRVRFVIHPALLFLTMCVYCHLAQAQLSVDNFSPRSANAGAVISITGNGFGTQPSANAVFFGPVAAKVNTATANTLNVEVPVGAAFGPVTVSVNGGSARSSNYFNPIFTGGGTISSTSFESRQSLDEREGADPSDMLAADFDKDGKIDVAFVDREQGKLLIYRNTSEAGYPSFGVAQIFNTGSFCYYIRTADLDGDGRLDIVVANKQGYSVSVFRNLSTAGTIQLAQRIDYISAVSAPANGLALADFDRDGKIDVAITIPSLTSGLLLLRNTSTTGSINFAVPVFQSITGALTEIQTADLDRDGYEDLVIGDLIGRIYLLRNVSTIGSFSFTLQSTLAVGALPVRPVIGDLNQDDRPDIVAGSSDNGSLVVFKNNTQSVVFDFVPQPTLFIGATVNGVCLEDVNGDGKPDIMATVMYYGLAVLQNNSTSNISLAGSVFFPWLTRDKIISADWDGDLRPDLMTSSSTNIGQIWHNREGYPQITSFEPKEASAGEQVTITGKNFTGVTAVSFGGTPAQQFSVVNDNSILAKVGAGASGNIQLTGTIGVSEIAGFSFKGPPVITSFSPTAAGKGSTVTIRGVNLDHIIDVSFGGIDAQSFTIVSPQEIRAVVGSGASGNVRVGGIYGSNSLPGFTILPVISNFSPTSAATGATLTINGSGFQDVTQVRLGGVNVSSFQIQTPDLITAIIPATAASGAVEVIAPLGSSSMPGFVFLAPATISSFAPASAGYSNQVTINGTGFTGVTSVKFGGVQALSFTVQSTTRIIATVGAGASGEVTVVTAGGIATRPGFTYLATPDISYFEPIAGGKGSEITIKGIGFQDATIVKIGGVDAPSFEIVDPSTIKAIVGEGAASGFVHVISGAAEDRKEGFVFRTRPFLHSFSPVEAAAGSVVTIQGANFNASVASTTVWFGYVKGEVLTVNPNKITVRVPQNAPYGTIMVKLDTFYIKSLLPFSRINAAALVPSENLYLKKMEMPGPMQADGMNLDDIDGDGQVDLVAFSSRNNLLTIYRNSSSAGSVRFADTITLQTTFGISSLKAQDLDGDGLPELVGGVYVGNVAGQSSIYILRNTSTPGTISFAPPLFKSVIGSPISLNLGDHNGDGKFDINIVASDISSGPTRYGSILTNRSKPGELIIDDAQTLYLTLDASNTSLPPYSTVVADFNKDGLADMAVSYAGQYSNKNYLSLMYGHSNIGEGAYLIDKENIQLNIYNSNLILHSEDLNRDGQLDIMTGPFFIKGLPQYNFQVNPVSGFQMKAIYYDLNGDGKPDYFSVDNTTKKWHYRLNTSQDGVFAFDTRVEFPVDEGRNAAVYRFADIDGDGMDDLIVLYDDVNRLAVYKNAVGYNGPRITSFEPDTAATGNMVVVSGEKFEKLQTVRLGGKEAQIISHTSTSITLEVPDNSISGNIEVNTEDGNVAGGWFTVIPPAPVINTFSPTVAGVKQTIQISGSNFYEVQSVTIGGTPITSYVIIANGTIIRAVINSNVRSGDIVVTTLGGNASKPGFSFAPEPEIIDFNPKIGWTGSQIVITGKNFSYLDSVILGRTPVQSFTVDSPTQITAVVGAGSTGRVFVYTTGGSDNSNQDFSFIQPPVIESYTPTSGTKTTVVTIRGANFVEIQSVKFGGVSAGSFTVVSPTEIRAELGEGASGNVEITGKAGVGKKSGFVYYYPPTITSFTPESGGFLYPIKITGTNFINVQEVSFGGVPAEFTVISSEQINAKLGDGATGDVKVTTPGGTAVKSGFVFGNYTPVVDIDNEVFTNIQLAPNPAYKGYTIARHPSVSRKAVIQIYSMEGRKQIQVDIPVLTKKTEIALTGIPAGHYLVVWYDGKDRLSQNLIIP